MEQITGQHSTMVIRDSTQALSQEFENSNLSKKDFSEATFMVTDITENPRYVEDPKSHILNDPHLCESKHTEEDPLIKEKSIEKKMESLNPQLINDDMSTKQYETFNNMLEKGMGSSSSKQATQ